MIISKPYHTVKRQIKDSNTELKHLSRHDDDHQEEHTSHHEESRIKRVPKIKAVAKEDVEPIALRLKMHLLENKVSIEELQQV